MRYLYCLKVDPPSYPLLFTLTTLPHVHVKEGDIHTERGYIHTGGEYIQKGEGVFTLDKGVYAQGRGGMHMSK